jgi:hypothetical protein
MPYTPLRWLLPATFVIAVSCAQAQDAPRMAVLPASALDASAAVPTLVYRSSLATYRRHSMEQPLSWREANDKVGRIGGWRAYAREANEPEAPSAPPVPDEAMPSKSPKPLAAPSVPQPKPSGHGGHHTH